MRRPGGRKAVIAATLAACSCAFACDGVVDPSACPTPLVGRSTVTENPTNVLSAFVTAYVLDADSVFVRFGMNGAMDITTPSFRTSGDSVLSPLLGLYPNIGYKAQLIAFNACGSTAGQVLAFATAALPNDLPTYMATGSAPSPGFVVFAAGGYGLVIDNSGRVVWYRRFPNGPGLNFQPQPNGRYAARPPSEAGAIASWVEIDASGSITRSLACAHDYPPRMHDMIAELDGSYWLLCDETRTMDLSSQGASSHARVLGTSVQHRSAVGDVLFEWSPFDHFQVDLTVLDAVDRNASVINWTHGNALDLDSDGNLLVSFRNLSEVTKIDTHTGAVIWRMGGSQNQITFENVSMPAFVHQHGLRAVGAGQIILLDNLGEASASRAERYHVDDAHHTSRLSASYGASAGLTASIGGNAQPLPNGHTLVSFGNGAGVEEYDSSGKVVWKIGGNPGYIFRAERIHSLYRPGADDPR